MLYPAIYSMKFKKNCFRLVILWYGHGPWGRNDVVLWGPLRFRLPAVSTWRGAAPPGGRYRRRWATRLGPLTLSLVIYSGSRAVLPSPCSSQLKPRGCRRVRHSITILGTTETEHSEVEGIINKASIIIIELISSYLWNYVPSPRRELE